MTRLLFLIWIAGGAGVGLEQCGWGAPNEPITFEAPALRASIPLADVRWDAAGFWGTRLTACREGTLPTLTRIMQGRNPSHFVENFRIAAGLVEGSHLGPAWNDGDTYKWIEALAAMFAQTGDRDLKATMDQAIAVIGLAQRDDGYLHTPVLIGQRKGIVEARPFNDPINFEMYNIGHLMTAACVHFEVTQERHLLDIAIKAADFLDRSFSDPDQELARHAVCPAHYMGIMDLYRVTQEPRYLQLCQRWLAMRDLVQGGDDNQDRIPFHQQREAVGHAVRANYLYAGAADLYLETHDATLLNALEACWQSVQQKKIYITGGCGALFDGASPDGSAEQKSITRVHQAYGRNYQLPNATAHNETCAAIGNVLWNYRMWQLSGAAKYVDALENSLYNAVLAGVSLDGQRFFYTNTLRQLNEMPTELRWSRQRQEWIRCYCCPPNVARTVAGVGRYAYSASQDALSVLLYGSNELDTHLADGSRLALTQSSNYPYDGRVQFNLTATPDRPYTLRLRIPGWCTAATLSINGVEQKLDLRSGSFVEVTQTWRPTDRLELDMELPVKLMSAHPLVEECLGQVAVQRGPLVYCLESCDLPAGARLPSVMMPRGSHWELKQAGAELPSLQVLHGELLIAPDIGGANDSTISPDGPESTGAGGADRLAGGDSANLLYREYSDPPLQRAAAVLVPYFAWGNREVGEMTVWIRVQP